MTTPISYPKKTDFSLIFCLYCIAFLLACSFVFFYPEVGRDYERYVHIVNDILEGETYKELGFYAVSKILLTLGLSPEQVIFFFRTSVFFLLLRFFYYASQEFRILGLCFFVLVPNIFFGSLNALHTWLAIAIFVQVFTLRHKANLSKHSLVFAIFSIGFHLSAVLFLLASVISYIKFSALMKWSVLVLALLSLYLMKPQLFYLLEPFGYTKYIGVDGDYTKFVIIGVVFAVVTFIGWHKNDRFRVNQLIFGMFFCLVFVIFFVVEFGVERTLGLRVINFFMPLAYISVIFFLRKMDTYSAHLTSFVAILILALHFVAIIDFHDALKVT